MAPRANWRGYLRVAELACPVALFSAASASERIAFHMLNRKTGHRLHRQFVDSKTGKPVDAADQVKGYETGQESYTIVEPDEIAAAIPDSDKTLAIQAFVSCDAIDDLYFERPYYLTPGAAAADQTFAVLREGMLAKKVVALARAVLFRRMRTVLLRAAGRGMIATTLSFDYEVRSARAAFEEVPDLSIPAEMLALAKHIIGAKSGKFDPKTFDDRYEAAVAEVVKAKLAGRPIKKVKARSVGQGHRSHGSAAPERSFLTRQTARRRKNDRRGRTRPVQGRGDEAEARQP